MDSRTRVEAALALQVTDRPPVGAWGHAFVEEWSPQALARITIDRSRRFGWDFVKFQPRATCFAEAFGARYRPSGHPLRGPVSRGPTIERAQDWSALSRVDATVSPLADQVSSIQLVASELGPSIPVIQTVFSPLTVAGYLVGKDRRRVVGELRDNPELMGNALDLIADGLIDFAGRSVDAGASGIFFAISEYATAETMPREIYENLVLPHDRKVLDSLGSAAWFNVLHLCGARLFFDLAGALPVHAVSWSIHDRSNPSLEEGIKLSRRAAMGGVAQKTTLVKGSSNKVADEVLQAARANGGRGVIVAPGCSVPPRAPQTNLQAIGKAIQSMH